MIYYEIHGDGHPLIMLHGNMESSEFFKAQVAFFKARYKVITIDSRGHGRSSFGDLPITIDLLADDVLDVMNTLDIKKAALLGFSDGGNIALRLAEKDVSCFPDVTRFSAMIVVGANLYTRNLKLSVILPYRALHLLFKALGFIPQCRRKAMLMSLVTEEQGFDEDLLRLVKIPILVMAGQNDMIKENHTRELAKLLPNATLNILPGASHFLLSERSDEANAIIDAFLNEQLTSSSG